MLLFIFIASVLTQKVPLVVTFNEPAVEWGRETFPIGNGYIGAMVYGKVDQEQIQINDHTLWSGGAGADPTYNGGITGDAATKRATLQTIRTTLQNTVLQFSVQHPAHMDGNNVVTDNYPQISGDIRNQLMTLAGEDISATFGQYQSLTDIEFAASLVEDQPFNVTGNCDNPNNGEKMANLFDGSDAKWYPGEDIEPPYIIGWQYGGPVTFNQYIFTTANDVPPRDPTNWTLEGSLDGTSWTVFTTVVNANLPNERNTPQTFTLDNTVTYQYFRLTITATRTATDHAQLSEIALVIGGGTSQPFSDYQRHLDVDDSFVSVSYTQNGIKYTREYFTSFPDNVIVVNVNASAPFSQDIRFRPTQTLYTLEASNDNASLTIQGRPSTHTREALTESLHFAAEMRVVSDGKVAVATTGRGLHIEGATSFTIFYTSATNYQQCKDDTLQFFSTVDPLPQVQKTLAAAVTKGYAGVRASHLEDYHSLFNRVRLNLPIQSTTAPTKLTWNLVTQYNQQNSADEDFYTATLYYQFVRYLMISSSRPGTLPTNLQGMWAEGLTPPWDSDFHLNVNMEMNYWPAESANLGECQLPFIDFIEALVPRGRLVAKHYYCKQDGSDVRGSVWNHATNIWSYATAKYNADEAGYFPTGAAWTANHLWEHYLFTQDEAYLKRIYPTLLELSIFWVDNLWTDERDGTLVTNPSYSPEHGQHSLGATCDQAIIWELFNYTLQAAELLGANDAELVEIRTAQGLLSGFHVGLGGQFQEWKDEVTLDLTGDGQHRHTNHLFSLHPGSRIVPGRSAQEDEWAEAIKKTLTTRGDGGPGWAKGWKVSLWARLLNGTQAHKPLELLFRESTYPNMLDIQPFQIDGNFGGLAGMTEMLLQSHGTAIHLIPALPPKWEASGSVIGLRARGAFEVCIQWSENTVTGAVLASLAGKDAVVRGVGVTKLDVVDSKGAVVRTTQVDENTISFTTTAGEVYTFGPGVQA